MVFVLGLSLNIWVRHNQIGRTSCLSPASPLPQTRGVGGAHQVTPSRKETKAESSQNVPFWLPVPGVGPQALKQPWALTEPRGPSLWAGGRGARRDPYPKERSLIRSRTHQEPYCFLHLTDEDTESLRHLA